MFSKCKSLISIDLSNFKTGNVSNMSSMFSKCNSLISIDLSNFKTDNVDNMYGMFRCCNSLKSINLINFNTSKVINMSYMFSWCEKLKAIDLSNFIINNKIKMFYLFSGCKALKLINFSKLSLKDCKFIDLIFKILSKDCYLIFQDIRGLKSEIINNDNKILLPSGKKQNEIMKKVIYSSYEEFKKQHFLNLKSKIYYFYL
jgi:surface protein